MTDACISRIRLRTYVKQFDKFFLHLFSERVEFSLIEQNLRVTGVQGQMRFTGQKGIYHVNYILCRYNTSPPQICSLQDSHARARYKTYKKKF